MTRAAIVAALAALLLATAARAAQCGCPPQPEPPVVVQPLPAIQPGGGYVWIAWVGK